MSKNKKIIIGVISGIFVIGVILVIGFIGLAMVFSGAETENKPDTVKLETSNKAKVNKEGTIEISAKQLSTEYNENEVLANKKYLDKKMKVSGEVTTITQIGDQEIHVSLSGGFLSTIDCNFYGNEVETNKIAELKQGDNVVVEGVMEKGLFPQLKNCTLK